MRQELPGWERGCETRVTWVGERSETRVTWVGERV